MGGPWRQSAGRIRRLRYVIRGTDIGKEITPGYFVWVASLLMDKRLSVTDNCHIRYVPAG